MLERPTEWPNKPFYLSALVFRQDFLEWLGANTFARAYVFGGRGKDWES